MMQEIFMEEDCLTGWTKYPELQQSALHIRKVGIESIRFMRPMPQGSFIDINAEVVHVGNTSMKIKITVMMDQDPEEEQVQTAEAFFTFVAVDENGKPHKVGRTL